MYQIIEKLELVSFLIYPYAGSHDMGNRSFKMELTDRSINDFKDALESRGSHGLTPGLITKTLPGIYTLEEKPTSVPEIKNGFMHKRFTFTLTVRSGTPSNYLITTVNGYTDRMDFTYNLTLAPDTELYVDTVTSIVTSEGRPPRRLGAFESLYNQNSDGYLDMIDENDLNTHGLSGLGTEPSPSLNIGGKEALVRPGDIVSTMQDTTLSETTGVTIESSVTRRSPYGVCSDVSNNIGSNSIGKVVNNYIDARNAHSVSYGQDTDILSTTLDALEETRSEELPLFAALKAVNNHVTPTVLTIEMLEKVIPNLTCDFVPPARGVPLSSPKFLQDEATMSTLSSGQEAKIGATLNVGIPAILLSKSIGRLAGEMTNRTHDGQFAIRPIEARMIFPGLILKSAVDAALFEIRELIWPVISNNNRQDLSIIFDFSVNSFGTDGTVDITIDGGPVERLVYSGLARNLLSPVLTNINNQQHIAAGFTTLLNTAAAFTDSFKNELVHVDFSLSGLNGLGS